MKVIKVFIAILILAVVGAAIAGVVVDNLTSAEIEKQIKMIDVPSNTTIDASVSRTGKLSDTNGPLEFYGALKAYYSSNSPDGLSIQVVSLEMAKNTFGDKFPEDLRFSHHDNSPKNYYIAYAFGTGQSPFPMMDYRTYFG